MTLEGKLARLRLIAPADYQAVERIVDDALRTRWWQLGPTMLHHHTQEK